MGYAIVIDELDMGVSSIAAPILDRTRNPVGAISVSASTNRIRDTIGEEKVLTKAIVAAAGLQQCAGAGHFVCGAEEGDFHGQSLPVRVLVFCDGCEQTRSPFASA